EDGGRRVLGDQAVALLALAQARLGPAQAQQGRVSPGPAPPAGNGRHRRQYNSTNFSEITLAPGPSGAPESSPFRTARSARLLLEGGASTSPSRSQAVATACTSRPSTGSAPTWPCAPSNWIAVNRPTPPRCSGRRSTGSRTGTWPGCATGTRC